MKPHVAQERQVFKEDKNHSSSIIGVIGDTSKGIVFGALSSDRKSINYDMMYQIREMSRGMKLTFHRAFDVIDVTSEDEAATHLDSVISVGCDRLLTSGFSSTAQKGIGTISRLVAHAAGRISVIAASGVNSGNVAEIIDSSGVHGVHTGSSVTELIDSRNRYEMHKYLWKISFRISSYFNLYLIAIKCYEKLIVIVCFLGRAVSGSTVTDDLFVWHRVNSKMVEEFASRARNGWEKRST